MTRPSEHAMNIFQDALTRSFENRSAFLDEACGGDASLRELVESLLKRHHEEVTSEFDAPPSGS